MLKPRLRQQYLAEFLSKWAKVFYYDSGFQFIALFWLIDRSSQLAYRYVPLIIYHI